MSAGEQLNPRKIINWPEYNRSLVSRGSITFWLNDEATAHWYCNTKLRPGRGLAPTFSDLALQTCLTIGAVYGLARRQTQGFVDSLFSLMQLPLRAPNHTIYSKQRGKRLEVVIPRVLPQGAVDLVIDSTGLKIFGEGEWKVRTHGTSQRRTWRKLHLAVDPKTHEIIAHELTTVHEGDSSVLPKLLDQLPAEQIIGDIIADGAYDSEKCYNKIMGKSGNPIIPPAKGSVPWSPRHPRTVAVRGCQTEGRRDWKRSVHYHRRSLAETAMYRYKTIIGDTMRARVLSTQKVEAAIGVTVINRMNTLGMPKRS